MSANKKSFNVAIAGATGAVGGVFIDILRERRFPIRELRLLASARSVGRKLRFGDSTIAVEELGHDSFEGTEIAFFSAGGSRSKEFAPSAAKAGAVVVDNSSAFRMDPEVPLVVPELNEEKIAERRAKGIIANPNCTTIVMLMGLGPIHRAFGARRVVGVSYQAVSGAGAAAMRELEDQVRAWTAGKPLEVKAFPHQIAFNLIPHIDAFLEDGFTKEEMKLVHETRKILGDDSIRVCPTTVRVPVFAAHAVSVTVETEKPVTVDAAREVFAKAPGLQVIDDPQASRYPMPLDATGQDDCFVGRIRKDPSVENGLTFWIVGDQLRKGAALNAVQIAERMIEKDL
jgi:aspartate-semialdehyde dehydrogenase